MTRPGGLIRFFRKQNKKPRTIRRIRRIRLGAQNMRFSQLELYTRFLSMVRFISQSSLTQNKCAEIKRLAERRAGEILRQSEKAKGGERYHKEPSTGYTPGTSGNGTPTYKEMGIDKVEAHRWQTIADMPEEKFKKL